MSEMRIELSDETPFYFVQNNYYDDSEIEKIFYQIKTSLYQRNLQETICFICIVGKEGSIKEMAISSYLDIVVLNRQNLYKIIESEHERRIFVNIIREQHGVSTISPFSSTRIPIGSMFYGRKEETQKVIRSNFDINFAVMGSRRIGKTSFILNLKRYLDNEDIYHTLFLDCYRINTTSEFIQQVISKLDVRSYNKVNVSTFHDFLKRMKNKYNKKIFLLLDEIDELLDYDKSFNWELSRIFHALASEDICKIIIAGFRKLYKELNNQNSPLFKYKGIG